MRQELAKRAFGWGLEGVQVALRAQSVVIKKLARAAASEPADLYIAHCLAALPAAAWAAHHHGAKLGFDAEDDHVGELVDAPENRFEIAIRQRIEQHFLPQCQHLTAASPGIARAYRERYGVIMTPILNVFPLSQASKHSDIGQAGDRGCALSLYWFSQTIGSDRGLEFLIKAMGKIPGRVTLSIRGNDILGYSERLKALAKDVGTAEAVRFLPLAQPEEMARLAAVHDVGVSSELNTPPNHTMCLGNKIFVYLLAGIPVLLSNTPAQSELAAQLGAAARLVDLNQTDTIVEALDELATNAEALAGAKREASRLSRARFNWDVEKGRFLESVKQALQ
jgi:glycosyltransferase involved in cell wall biosynthesis